ncbi:MAG: hypothetical protein PHN56_02650 [Candidatus Nanoarchaeia archaeon]|jgi:hypothetical protein|nr:hypothetical protein [Candidatus Nanoarchaeia archaeon]
MKKILILISVMVLIAGCTQPNTSNVDLSGLEELGDLPAINASGMGELGSLPSTNISINLDTGMPASNPFPSQPELE